MTDPLYRYANGRLRRTTWQRGAGPYVADTQRMGRTMRVEVLSIKKGRVPGDVRDALLPATARFAGDVLVRIRRYFADGVPMQLAKSYVPWDIAYGTSIACEDTGPGGIYARLEDAGHRLWRFREIITVHRPDETIRRLLDVDDAVTRIVRIAYDMSGTAVEICDTVMASERYTLVYDISPDGLGDEP